MLIKDVKLKYCGFWLDLNFKVEADALNGVGTYLAVSHCNMGRMRGVGFQSLGAFKGGVEHHVAVG